MSSPASSTTTNESLDTSHLDIDTDIMELSKNQSKTAPAKPIIEARRVLIPGFKQNPNNTKKPTKPMNVLVGVKPTTTTPRLTSPGFQKCMYKTGKCLSARAVKKNGAYHSLCEEHREKQNQIQRRSDRKYQLLHAQRRRQRTQQRAVMRQRCSSMLPHPPHQYPQHQLFSFADSSPLLHPLAQPQEHQVLLMQQQLQLSSKEQQQQQREQESPPSPLSSPSNNSSDEDCHDMADMPNYFSFNTTNEDDMHSLSSTSSNCSDSCTSSSSHGTLVWTEEDVTLLHEYLLF